MLLPPHATKARVEYIHMHCSTSTNVLGSLCGLFAGHTSENLYEGGWSAKIAFGELEALKGCRANSNGIPHK